MKDEEVTLVFVVGLLTGCTVMAILFAAVLERGI